MILVGISDIDFRYNINMKEYTVDSFWRRYAFAFQNGKCHRESCIYAMAGDVDWLETIPTLF